MANNESKKLLDVVEKNGKYPLEAYYFIFRSLEFTLANIGERKHISGKELLNGIKNYALQEFGGLAKMVFN